jgi:hypothetical protein
MIRPETNSLLVLHDDAQSIYNGPKKLRFTFSSVGVQAKGRTTIHEAAKTRHLQCWSGATRDWQPVQIVYLNPEKDAVKNDVRKEKYTELLDFIHSSMLM